MQIKTALLLTAAAVVGWPLANANAGSIETQNNEVADGGIVVLNGDTDRSDWAGIPTYQADVDAVVPLLSYGNISIAHDSTKIYFRLLMDSFEDGNPDQSWFGAHHAILIDTDQDRSTGWIGGDLDPLTDDDNFAIGADYYIEGPAVWRYGTFTNPPGPGQNRELWTWGNVVAWGGILYDDGPPSDIEFEILKSDIGLTSGTDFAFDFVPRTTTATWDIADIYPNLGVFDPVTQTEADGEYFTYDSTFVAPNLEGDLNEDGFVGLDDLDIVLQNWNQNVPPADARADPSGDGFVGLDDLDTVLNNWNAGTPPAGSAVPEPATLALLGLGAVAALRRRA